MYGVVILAVVLLGVDASTVSVRDVTAAIGDNVTLDCQITTTDTVSQITWQRQLTGQTQKANFYIMLPNSNVWSGDDTSDKDKFLAVGNVTTGNISLTVSAVTFAQAGVYTCIVTTFPSGSHNGALTLDVFSPPVNTLTVYPMVHNSSEPTDVVVCSSTDSYPKAEVLMGSLPCGWTVNTTTTELANKTFTVTATVTAPANSSREHNGNVVSCEFRHRSLNETLQGRVSVLYPPQNVFVELTMGGHLVCRVDSNPPANITWKGPKGEDLGDNATLAPRRSGLYSCQATNSLGSAGGVKLPTVPTRTGSASRWPSSQPSLERPWR